jgi:hypothetical protein
MESSIEIVLVRYWNYIFAPLFVLIALFGVYVLSTLTTIQTMSNHAVATGIHRISRS